ncbi:restriction endonuclease subunit S [Staphylococcus xylosus]
MTNEIKNVPELRFPGFSKEWKAHYLNEILEVKAGKDYKHLEKGEYPVYGTGGYMLSVSNFLYEEEAIGIGRKGTINKPYLLKGPFWTVDTLFYCVPKNENEVQFLLNLFKTINWKIYDESTGVPSLSKVTINKINKIVPEFNEQQKIGDFFSKLDRQIELEEQKLEKLEEQKKGYMQKIFSQELRFKDENGQEYPAWINKKLGDIGKVSMNKRIYKNETSINGEIPFYKIGTFGKEAETFISREKFEEYKNKYPYPEKGDILISASGSIGRTIEYDGEEAYYQDSNIVWLDHNDEVLNIFLKYIYSVIKWSGIEGTTIKRLYNKDILNTKIDLPVIKEQEKIGNFFGKIDDSIEKQSSKIGVLKQRKKGFLQKMFV